MFRKLTGYFSHRRWKKTWDARLKALEVHLGPSESIVHHAIIPLFMGGEPDVVEFRSFCDGVAYATAELTDPYDADCPEDSCEFVVCTRQPTDWYWKWMRLFAHLSLDDAFRDGDLIDFTQDDEGPAYGSHGFLFIELSAKDSLLSYMGKSFKIMLVMNLMPEELRFQQEHGTKKLIERLREANVYPFSDLNRPPVV